MVDNQCDYKPHGSHKKPRMPTSNFNVYDPNKSSMYPHNSQSQHSYKGHQRCKIISNVFKSKRRVKVLKDLKKVNI